MKILLASYWCVPYMGGVSTYTLALKEGLEQRGHVVEILSHHPDGIHYYVMNEDRYLPKSKVKEPILEQIRSYYAARQLDLSPWMLDMEAERYSFEAAAAHFGLAGYDLIHSQEVISSRGLSRIKPVRVPLVTTIHGVLSNEWLAQGVIRERGTLEWEYAIMQERLGVTSADVAMVPTLWLKNLLLDTLAIPSERLTVLPLGLKVDSFQKKMARATGQPPPADKALLICPARFDEVKGHRILLDALACLKQQRTDWRCWLVGDGPLQEEMRARCRELGLLEMVQFMGHRNDVPALLRQADIVVIPSLQDNHPYAVMEAQTACKAIAASDAGGIPELVHHRKTGLLFPSGDSSRLCETLQHLLADPGLREYLGANAGERGRTEWALERMIDRIEAVYVKAMNQGGAT